MQLERRTICPVCLIHRGNIPITHFVVEVLSRRMQGVIHVLRLARPVHQNSLQKCALLSVELPSLVQLILMHVIPVINSLLLILILNHGIPHINS
jgi:hypothetical protein